MWLRFLIILLISTFSRGQAVYSSHSTQYFPSTRIEKINRTLKVEEDLLKIVSTTSSGAEEIQVLSIARKFRRNIEDVINSGEHMIYQCISQNDNLRYVITIPETSKVEFIDVYIPEQENTEATYYRLLINPH